MSRIGKQPVAVPQGVTITADLAAAAMMEVNGHDSDRPRPLLLDMTGIAALSRDAVADVCEHVGNRIGHHRSLLRYQLALITPGR